MSNTIPPPLTLAQIELMLDYAAYGVTELGLRIEPMLTRLEQELERARAEDPIVRARAHLSRRRQAV